eukprot:1438988-Pyramimonas_sp.AAC.1
MALSGPPWASASVCTFGASRAEFLCLGAPLPHLMALCWAPWGHLEVSDTSLEPLVIGPLLSNLHPRHWHRSCS